jgi:hypothetical protein
MKFFGQNVNIKFQRIDLDIMNKYQQDFILLFKKDLII